MSDSKRQASQLIPFSVLALLVLCMSGCGTSQATQSTKEEEQATPVAASATTAQQPEEPQLKYPIPDGPAEELAAFLGDMAQRTPTGESPEEETLDLADIMVSRIHAANQIMSLPDVEAIFRIVACEAKLESLRVLALIGQRDEADFVSFADELIGSDDLDLVRLGRIGRLQQQLDETRNLGTADTEELLSSVNEIAAPLDESASESAHPDLRVLYVISETSDVLRQIDELDAATTTLQRGAELLEDPPATESVLSVATRFAGGFEVIGQVEPARTLYEMIRAKFSGHENERLRATAEQTLQLADKRFERLGQPLELTGETVDGEPFDKAAIEDKVVIAQFWMSADPACEPRIAELRKLHLRYHERGLEVIGVSLDEDDAALSSYLASQEIVWPTIRCADEKQRGFSDPNAVRNGIAAVPYALLADTNGTVVALNPNKDQLRASIEELLEQREQRLSDDAKPAQQEATAGEKTNDAAADETELDDDSADVSDDPSANEAKPEEVEANSETTADTAREPQDKADGEEISLAEFAERNPYAPDDGMSVVELVEFILEMQDKSRSIQRRDGFVAGIIEAADRVLSADTKDRYQVLAALAKFTYLHRDASRGDDGAEEALRKMTQEFAADTRPEIAAEVAFLVAEQNVLAGEGKPADEATKHIDAAISFFAQSPEGLGPKHLRMASATVGLINDLNDGQQRENYFQQLAEHLVKSSDKQVSRYGKRIAGTRSDDDLNKLVGKPLKLNGETVDGNPFDWQAYRGSVVLVDFWATWCGPCRAMMPDIEELYNAQHDRGFDVVGISLDEDLDQLADFLAEHEIPWTLLAGAETAKLADEYGIRGIPLLILVDAEGKVVTTGHKLEAMLDPIQKLLGELENK